MRASNSGPPRIGSQTGKPSRADSASQSCAALASFIANVFNEMPPQRIFGFVRDPNWIVRSMIVSTEGTANSSSPGSRRASILCRVRALRPRPR